MRRLSLRVASLTLALGLVLQTPRTGAQPAASAEAPAASAEVAPAVDPSPTPAPDASAAAAAPAPVPVDGATYRVRLLDLAQRVDELKEQIRRSHTRLSLLSDTILPGATGGARAEIEFENDLSGAWRLIEAVFVLDGVVQYKKVDESGRLSEQKKIPIFAGSIPTGDHTLQVLLKLRGHGFGVFSYLRGVEATVRHDHSFTVTDGKVLELHAVAWEQGGPTTPVEEQPDIRFSQGVREFTATPAPAPTPDAAAPTGTSGASGSVTGTEMKTEASVGGGN